MLVAEEGSGRSQPDDTFAEGRAFVRGAAAIHTRIHRKNRRDLPSLLTYTDLRRTCVRSSKERISPTDLMPQGL
jgi:hypothetical protein